MAQALLLLVALAFAAAAVASFIGRRRFAARVRREAAVLEAEAGAGAGPEQLAARMDSLPEPVRRYLLFAIPESAPATRTVHVQHGGYFRTRPGQRWLAIEGEQYFTAAKPGFVWDACIRPAPLLWIEARDCLLPSGGNMLVKLNSCFRIADARGERIDQSARARWLMEAVWFPYAFAGDRITWEAVDARSARTTLRESGEPVSVTFEFDEDGSISRLTALRYRDTGGGRSVLTPWIGRCQDYRDFGGFRVPVYIEGSWQLDGGEFTYVRFRVTTVEYNIDSETVRRAAPSP